tara:strand:+ start:422 stop:1555 length:1134 start_codon:yes stop_codon:yes gene_type:complete
METPINKLDTDILNNFLVKNGLDSYISSDSPQKIRALSQKGILRVSKPMNYTINTSINSNSGVGLIRDDAVYTNMHIENDLFVDGNIFVGGRRLNKDTDTFVIETQNNDFYTFSVDYSMEVGPKIINIYSDTNCFINLVANTINNNSDGYIFIQNNSNHVITLSFDNHHMNSLGLTHTLPSQSIAGFNYNVYNGTVFLSCITFSQEACQHFPKTTFYDLSVDDKLDLQKNIIETYLKTQSIGNLQNVPNIDDALPGQILRLSTDGENLEWFTPPDNSTRSIYITNENPNISFTNDTYNYIIVVASSSLHLPEMSFLNGTNGIITIKNTNNYQMNISYHPSYLISDKVAILQPNIEMILGYTVIKDNPDVLVVIELYN